MIRITQRGVVFDSASLPRLRQDFATTGIALLPGFLSPEVRDPLLRQVERTRFQLRNEGDHSDVMGTTLFSDPSEAVILTLHFALNRPELFRVVEEIVQCPKLGNFLCRLHRTTSESGQHLDWHHDVLNFRTVGLNINLGNGDYTGGMFQLRNPEGQTTGDIKHVVPGDAFLFRIDHGWKHRLTAVESGTRTVGVGWFRTQPEWEKIALPGFLAGTISLESE